MDKEIIKLLNETTYDENEIEEFMEFANIDDYKLEKITNDVKTKIAKDSFKKVGYFVKSILNENESIEKIIKGTDIDLMEEYTAISAKVKAPFMTSDGYAINKIIFITNKRIIILDSNYYNKVLGYESYELDEIKNITIGKKIKRKYRLHQFFKENSKLIKILFFLFAAIPILFGIGLVGYLVNELVRKFITDSEFVLVTISRIIVFGSLYFIIFRSKLANEVLIELKNGKKYDIIIRNKDYKEIQDYLENLNKNF